MKWLDNLLGIAGKGMPKYENPPPPPQIRPRPKPDFEVGDKVTINYLIQSDEGVVAGEPYYATQLPGLTSADWYVPVRSVNGKITNPVWYLVHKIEL